MIYFIQNGDFNKIKIGYTANPVKRISDLQTGSPTKLNSIFPAIDGERKDETEIHKLLELFKIGDGGKDWFRYCEESKKIIEDWIKAKELPSNLPLMDFAMRQADPYLKYNLLPKWEIVQLKEESRECPGYFWGIKQPNGKTLLEKTLIKAQKTRLWFQYYDKYRNGSGCWFPDDVYP